MGKRIFLIERVAWQIDFISLKALFNTGCKEESRQYFKVVANSLRKVALNSNEVIQHINRISGSKKNIQHVSHVFFTKIVSYLQKLVEIIQEINLAKGEHKAAEDKIKPIIIPLEQLIKQIGTSSEDVLSIFKRFSS